MADYISRDAIDKWIVDSLAQYGNRYTTDQLNMFGLFRTVINDHSLFPAADVVERKNGKWIIKDNPGTGWYRVTCSACGEDVTSTAPVIGFFPDAKITWNYCPECGSYNGGDDDV